MSEFRTVHLWYKSPDYLYEASTRTSMTLDSIIVGEPLGAEAAILSESGEWLLKWSREPLPEWIVTTGEAEGMKP